MQVFREYLVQCEVYLGNLIGRLRNSGSLLKRGLVAFVRCWTSKITD